MNNKPKTKLLTISLLCCGRPETTERCLQSLMPIREAIDSEIQVVDTGCSPETRAVIEKYADEVFEFEWCNDFAKARNFQLDQANGKMFLYIDDDEWFLDCKYIIEFFQQPDCTTYNIGGYFQHNYLDFDGKEYQDIEVCRMCSVTPETHFVGKIHEYIEPSYGRAMFMDAKAAHFGYVYATEEENIKHSMRNVPLLREMMEEDPDNLRWPYQLAQELKAIKQFDEMYDVCKAAAEKSLIKNDSDDMRYRGSFICGMAIALHQTDKNKELEELYETQAKNPTIMELPLACLAFYVSTAYFNEQKNDECLAACNYYLKICDKLANNKAEMFIQGGLFSADTFDTTKVNMVYCFIMTIGMENDDFGPLVHYYRRIAWDSPIVRLNRGFIVMLLKKCSELGYKKELRDVLNKFFTSSGFRDMIEFHIDKVAPDLSEQELENVAAAFKTTDGEKEIRLYIDIRLLEKQFAGIEYWDSYDELIEALANYGNMTLTWQQMHDSWLLDEDDDKPLNHSTKLGQGLQQFIAEADVDVTASLKILKNLFGFRPAMTGALGELSRLYTMRIKIRDAKRNDPDKFNEMYKLEETILAQIAELDAAGRSDEAVATYQQLVGILQNTFGVDTLHG